MIPETCNSMERNKQDKEIFEKLNKLNTKNYKLKIQTIMMKLLPKISNLFAIGSFLFIGYFMSIMIIDRFKEKPKNQPTYDEMYKKMCDYEKKLDSMIAVKNKILANKEKNNNAF